jgi:DNA processing protein
MGADEQTVVNILIKHNDIQLNILSVQSNIPIGKLTAILFQLEMKGIVKPLAGGTYHLII